MSRTYKDSKKSTGRVRQRVISVRDVRKDPPELRKLSRALIQLAIADDEAQAQAQAAAHKSLKPDQPAGPKPEADHV